MSADVISLEHFPAYLSTQKTLSRYDPALEKKPNHVWYRMDKAGIDELLKAFSHSIVDMLSGSPADDRELQHLYRTATELANVIRSPAIKVALIGAQGAGKSLSLNALFDCDGLSLTGADGAACTSSITRYIHYSGEFKFSAEIKFLSAAKRETLLKEHARNFFHYQHADIDSDDEETPRRKTAYHDEMERRLKDTAEDVFLTLFGSRDAFEGCWSSSSYKSGEFVRICQLKCEETLHKEDGASGTAIKLANDQKDFLKQLKPFLTKVKGVTCLWPLVDHVTVKFDNELLKSGIEIIDLPGWGDSNLSRVRHAEEIKDGVDVELILADIIRISSDDKVINTARAAVAHHGPENVKVITTKIDAFSSNQLSQCSEGKYDVIKGFMQDAEHQEAKLDDDEDDNTLKHKNLIDKYKSYLDRSLKQTKVLARNEEMTAEISAKLQGRKAQDVPETLHTSASDYMEWIKPAKINFKSQPSLPVEMTGIPKLRQFLYSLPTKQNMEDYEHQINTVLPNFIEKIKYTVNDSDRNGGFGTIAEEFDTIFKPFMERLLSQAKSRYQMASDGSVTRIQGDVACMKDQVTELFLEEWNEIKAAAFNRILKNRGTVPRGASKAKGLENGANWNKDLANILTPSFHKWASTYTENMGSMQPAFAYAFDRLHKKVLRVMSNSSANLPTVEKAKKRWAPLHHRVQAKILGLMEAITRVQTERLEWATMAYDRENNLIADITDDIYTEVFNTVPALKAPNPKAKRQCKQYVEPKMKFQKRMLSDMFLHGDRHFIDTVINHFQGEFDKKVRSTLGEHFASIEKVFEDFSKSLSDLKPINYILTVDGEAIRADVGERIPELEQKVKQLQALLPARASQVDSGIEIDNIDVKEDEDNLALIFEIMAKRKKTEDPTGRRQSKRIKQEPL